MERRSGDAFPVAKVARARSASAEQQEGVEALRRSREGEGGSGKKMPVPLGAGDAVMTVHRLFSHNALVALAALAALAAVAAIAAVDAQFDRDAHLSCRALRPSGPRRSGRPRHEPPARSPLLSPHQCQHSPRSNVERREV